MSNVTVTDTVYNITVTETNNSVTVTSGDAIQVYVDTFTISTGVFNSGTGAEVGKEITGDTLFLRTISAGDDIVVTQNADDITIALAGTIDADVIGNTTGTHFGPVTGDVTGDLTGDVTGNINSDVSSINILNDVNEINNTNNITITPIASGYLHANVGNVYVGTFTQAAHITPTEIKSIGTPLQITGNLTGNVTGDLTGNVTGQVSDISNHTTDDLTEGSTNLYYTDARSRAAVSATGSISYDNTTGVISYTQPTNVSAFINDAGYLTAETSTGISNVVDDTSPQLGGNLDTNGFDIDFADNNKATFGTGEDLWIYHDGGSSYIFDRGFGNLRIVTNSTVNIDGASGGEFMAQFVSNGAVSLWHDNSKKFDTTSTGVSITGEITTTGGNSINWNTAYGWGDHAAVGYLQNLNGLTTSDLAEGSNLYYTDERVDDRVNTLLQAGSGIALDYNDVDGELTITSDLMEEVVKNETGATLLKGTPVYVTGVSGDKPTVAPARADDATKMPAIGVLNEDIANDAEGSMLIMGRISDVDTSAFSQGDTIYVAPTGGYTNIKPTSVDTLVQNLGFVTKVHATNGGGIVYGSGRSNDTPNEITHTMIPSSNAIDLGAAGDNANDNTQSYFGRIYGQQLYTELLVPRNGGALSVNGDFLPTGNLQHDLGSLNNQWRSAYIGPGSLYIDGQKVLGSDETGAIDITTDAGQNLNISSGADIQFLTQANATGTQAFTVNLTDINLGPSGGGATVNVNGLLEAPDLHIGDLEIEPGLINYTQVGQNLEIRTNNGYLHANVSDLYVGPLTGAVKIDENTISSTVGNLTITGDLVGDVTGTVSSIANHTTTDLTEGSNLYFTDARAISAVQGEATLDLTGNVTISQDLDVTGLITVDDGYSFATFNPYAAFGGTAMSTTVMGIGQESGWAGLTVRSRGEHDWGLGGFGIPPSAPRSLLALTAGRLNGSADDYLNNGDKFASVLFNPYSDYRTGTEWLTPSIELEAVATEDHSSSGMGAKLVIHTTENGNFAGATDTTHANKTITIQGTTLTTSDTLKIDDDLIITGSISNDSGDIVINDKVEINGSNAKETIIGDDLIAGVFDIHGIKVKADDTAWGSVVIQEYEGGANKPFANGFLNPSFGTEIIGGTPSSPTNVSSGKRVFLLQALAANQTDGTLPTTANFRIRGETTEAQTTSARGTKVSVETIANGATATTESLVIQGNEVTINNSGDGILKSGGNIKLGSALDTNGQNIINSGGDVTINDNLKVNSNLTVDGTANLNGNVNLGNANTDSIQATGYLKANNGFGLTVLNTATANYLSGVLGIISQGDVAYITDGDSGSPCIGVYNGSSWKRIALGSDISSS